MIAAPQLPGKLAICVTFHYVEDRLRYLDMISDHFATLGEDVSVMIVTNSDEADTLARTLARTRQVLEGKGFDFDFLVPTGLGHPFLLTWSHLVDFREKIKDPSFTHFLYLEDDILVTRRNMEYWMQAREELRRRNFIPSFLRVERKDGCRDWYSTDCKQSFDVLEMPRYRTETNPDRIYVSVPTPYQGMYLMDRELMLEHLSSRSCVPEGGGWGIREKAARGLTFERVRKGYYSRNLLPFSLAAGKVDDACFIHHTPNNYANQTGRADRRGTLRENPETENPETENPETENPETGRRKKQAGKKGNRQTEAGGSGFQPEAEALKDKA